MSSKARNQEKREIERGMRYAEAGESRDLMVTPAELRGYDERIAELARERRKHEQRYNRAYSTMTPSEVCERDECDLQEAERLIDADRLLDDIDAARDVYELRECIKRLAIIVTGRE